MFRGNISQGDLETYTPKRSCRSSPNFICTPHELVIDPNGSTSQEESESESTSGADEFNDGLDSALMDGPDDKAILDQMTEAEREQEIYRHLSCHERLDERNKIYKQMIRVRRQVENRERET